MARLLLLLALPICAACHGPQWDRVSGSSDSPLGPDAPRAVVFPVGRSILADVSAEPGVYATDARFRELATSWGERVDRALERLTVVTSLGFDDRARPQVVLGSLGDERVPYELRSHIRAGRRGVRLFVNAEPLLAGVLDPDAVLLRSLGAAALEDAARRHGPVPRWLVEMTGTAAAGELGEVLRSLRRRAFGGDPDVLRIDPADPSTANATSVAALLLVTEQGDPGEMRRLLRFVADGDPAEEVLARIAHRPDGGWVEAARFLFRERLGAIDAAPWRMLRAAEEAARESGRAGLEAALPTPVPREIASELLVLRTRAALTEGDRDAARALLRGLGNEAPAQLREPAVALALRIRVETGPGGDNELARRLALELDRDFPRSEARAALRREHPLLGMEEDPRRWMAFIRTRVQEEGTQALDLRTIERYARTLLQDHRAGAAQRFLEALGERGTAPELAGVVEAIAEAQGDPSPAALERNARRVEVWYAAPAEDTARDVRDGGRASVPALAKVMEKRGGPLRRATVRLLVETAGTTSALATLESQWGTGRARPERDLDHLLAVVSFGRLRAAVSVESLQRLGVADPEAMWSRLRSDLAPSWLAIHPSFLAEIRHEDYTVRRGAFESLQQEPAGTASPALVARGLNDPAALLRRLAIRLAHRGGHRALARRGLSDRAWLVREEACSAVASLEGDAAVGVLARLLRDDEAQAVRNAAARALMRVAPGDPVALRALIDTQVEDEGGLRDVIAAGLAELDARPVVRAVVHAWSQAVEREKPHRGFLFRTALLFQRLTGKVLEYYPGATRAELRALLGEMRAWLRSEADRRNADARNDRRAIRDVRDTRRAAGPRRTMR